MAVKSDRFPVLDNDSAKLMVAYIRMYVKAFIKIWVY